MPSSVINSDDGVISGTSGLKSSGGDDGVLVFQSKGTETARINTDKQIVAAAGTASLPALTTTGDVNTGIFFPAADTIAFAEGGAEAMRIDSSGNVGIGVTPSAWGSPFANVMQFTKGNIACQSNSIQLMNNAFYDGSNYKYVATAGAGFYEQSGGVHLWQSAASGTAGNNITFTERMRIDSSGNVLIAQTTASTTNNGCFFEANESNGNFYLFLCNTISSGGSPLYINRHVSDGDLIVFRHADTTEGSVSVSGSTVSYNGGHLSRWAQMLTKPDLLKGTVMSNLDEMNVYIAPTTYWTEEDELPEGVNVGDVKVETHEVQNEQLNKVKVSDVEGDANVAGVFVNWTYDEAHQVDEINMAMTGDMIIRIAQGVAVARGDLLMSAGDGTAKPQGDDIVRSKTIAKVTSTHVTCTYDDGSYCVPCVLMAC